MTACPSCGGRQVEVCAIANAALTREHETFRIAIETSAKALRSAGVMNDRSRLVLALLLDELLRNVTEAPGHGPRRTSDACG